MLLMMASKAVRDNKEVENGEVLSLNGKLNHYMHLVPGGPWQRGFLLKLGDCTKPKGKMIEVGKPAKEQAAWWIPNIQTACHESQILDPRSLESMNPINIYTDAAGGNSSKVKNGIGGFIPPHNWCYMPWPSLIRDNRMNSLGVKFANKLTSLEGFAALLGFIAVPDLVRNRDVRIYCDNSGFVAVYRKKHSSCEYAYTVAKALHDVADGLGSIVRVVKTKRCSGEGEIAADSLSKGDWAVAWGSMPEKNVDPERIPRAALRWINNPTPDMNLGEKILMDMSKYTNVLYMK